MMNYKTIFDLVYPNDNDMFSKINKTDLQEVFNLINSYYLEYRDKLDFEEYVTFGTELEFEYAMLNKIEEQINLGLDKNWSIEVDASLVITNGCEVISPVLKDEPVSWENLKKACNIIKEYASIGEYSGGHIHIGTHVLGNNPQSWLNFIKLWSVYENIIFRFSFGEFLIVRPSAYEFAEPIRDDLWLIYKKFSESKLFLASDIVKRIKRFGGDRAINLEKVKNFDKYELNNTIEIRCPNGSLEPIIWQNNVNFFVKMLEYAKSDKYDDALIKKRYIANRSMYTSLYDYNKICIEQALELCDMIFTNNLDKIYFLRQYLKSFQVGEFDFVKAKKFIKN